MDNDLEYESGVDYIITGMNKIKWIGERPACGSAYSVRYIERPTYTVAKSLPQLRTSENQRLPRKALLQYLSVYAEGRAANKQR
jgi:hypothetical protein